jgi:serine/threonine protein kinase/Tfp pilus assembly protein PilF
MEGDSLGRFEILSLLGEGGMGQVYLAQDPQLERKVAIKVLPAEVAKGSAELARFQRESKAIASLSHPNIRTIFTIDSDKDRTFAVMEFLEGETLADRLKRSPFDWPEAAETSLAVAYGLAAAHSKGFIHRDIKPQNIFITAEGGVKIMDFGLAHYFGESDIEEKADDETWTQHHRPESFAGTPAYMSPEQIRNKSLDARTDIFAFGCVLYEMLYGEPLFNRESPADTIAAVLTEDTSLLTSANRRIPAAFQQLLNLCLEKDPAVRLQSMQDIIIMLRGIRQDSRSTGAGLREASVAVLPFVNLSSDQENEYFSDGLTEELINSLSKIEELHVASRTSSFLYKDKIKDIRHIGRQLGVRTVVEGSVRKAGNRLRIAAQLINVTDGYHRWSEIYDRELEDVFAIQSEIGNRIAGSLRVVLTQEEKHLLTKVPTANAEAYDYWLRGRHCFFQLSQKSIEQARKLFNRAQQLDPGYANASAWVAICNAFIYSWFGPNEETLNEAEKFSRLALHLDPKLSEAHVSRAMALLLKKQVDEAVEEFEIALNYKPDTYEEYFFYGRLCFEQDELEKAARLMDRASQLRPEDYNAPYMLGMVYLNLGQETEANAAFLMSWERVKKQLELFPEDIRTLYLAGAASIRMGERERGLEFAERALAEDPSDSYSLYGIACNFALLGQEDRAIDCLEKAMSSGPVNKKWVEHDPDLDSLRDHPRFKAFLDRL